MLVETFNDRGGAIAGGSVEVREPPHWLAEVVSDMA
jgi:hypothetical protein